jgi:predicted amidohydrolase YtcJ
LALYEELAEEGALSARVSVHLKAGRSLQAAKEALAAYSGDVSQRGLEKPLLNVRGIKLYMDGAPPGKTALMFEDYACCPGEKGILLYDGETQQEQVEEINRSMDWLHRQGYQMAVHTDGDHSANIAIEGLILAMGNTPAAGKENPLRHYLIHGDLVTDEDITRMAQWHIGLTTQPVITNSAGHVVSKLWGPERGNRHMAPGLFVSAGVWTSISTDAPIVPPDWKQNIEFAVLRKNATSPPGMARPEYRISVKEAIIAYTRTPAYQEFQEDIKGTIEAGKLADLTVIDKNPLDIDPGDISELKTLMTVLGGKVVYENLGGAQ